MDKVTLKIKLDTDSSGVTSATVDVNELDKAVESVVKSVSKAKGSFGDFADSAMAMAAVSELANNLNDQIQSLSASHNDFNQAMRAVNTMAGKDEAEFKKLTDQVTELGKTTAKTRTELADGLYQVIITHRKKPQLIAEAYKRDKICNLFGRYHDNLATRRSRLFYLCPTLASDGATDSLGLDRFGCVDFRVTTRSVDVDLFAPK